ncbi:MAG: hypothetical protein HY660_02850 [Armatimonadetes bacterium]|nr:hypothetical protein [Armatimonadota bacterium]
MKGCLLYSLVGEATQDSEGRESLIAYDRVPYDRRLDSNRIAIHTKWIVFDEPVLARVELWADRDDARSAVFQAAEALHAARQTQDEAGTWVMRVRLRRDVLQAGRVYWVKIFRGDELITHFPLQFAASPVKGQRARPRDGIPGASRMH